MPRTLTIVLIVFLLAACAPTVNAPAEAAADGVKGQALLGPMCPVVREGIPCPDEPYQTTLMVLTLDGREVTRFETDMEGKFQVNLPPGDYILHPHSPAGRFLPSAPDVPFTVLPGEYTNIIITFDSGIR